MIPWTDLESIAANSLGTMQNYLPSVGMLLAVCGGFSLATLLFLPLLRKARHGEASPSGKHALRPQPAAARPKTAATDIATESPRGGSSRGRLRRGHKRAQPTASGANPASSSSAASPPAESLAGVASGQITSSTDAEQTIPDQPEHEPSNLFLMKHKPQFDRTRERIAKIRERVQQY